VLAAPPGSPRATRGSSASWAVECRKNTAMRSRMPRMRLDWRTNCTPTRIALVSFSRPSGLSWCWRRQRMMVKPATSDSTALSTNT
jgi:hypothetical protein